MTSNKPEHIYLIPDRVDGVDCDVWCDDPAPTPDHDPSEAVQYVRADIHEALQSECEKLRKDADQYRRLIELGEDFQWENIIRVDISDFPSRADAIAAATQEDNPC